MSFADAIKSVLSQYATFSGRARRSEYWFWFLAYFIVAIVASFIDQAMGVKAGQPGPAVIVLALALLLPNLAVTVRRLHDTDRSGWWILIGAIPLVGAIVLLVFYVSDSKGNNKYGKSPKQVEPYQYA